MNFGSLPINLTDNVGSFACKNTTEETIRPYSAMVVSDVTRARTNSGFGTGVMRFSVARPALADEKTQSGSMIVFNGGAPIGPASTSGSGRCYLATPVFAELFQSCSRGDIVGVMQDSWKLYKVHRIPEYPVSGYVVIKPYTIGTSYYALVAASDQRLSFVRGTAVSSFTGPADISVTSLTGIDGNAANITTPITVKNIHSWDGDADAVVVAQFNRTLQQWEGRQLDCP